ncbi:hard surface induced 3 (sterol glycosyl transferase) [Fusarium beomiforme]|uniref:Hard surface induced 3 (Sterol glycosyl transferase) n=1 Tax=Fusarium beomiforme TaxID=44412 RepID=A0A9P5A8L8_9HYPO|nr:hard surface induced 3 (sterol glycosyl transferase) [Fusarium beomiforme]
MMLPKNSSRAVPWLHGLRGIGALLVYFHHHQLFARDTRSAALLESSYGYMGRYELATLPILRLLFSGGHFAVAVFFVSSGYALSMAPLRLIHKARFEELGGVLASSLFRRWFRLFAPVFVTTLAFILFQHALLALWPATGLYEVSWYDDLKVFWKQLREFTFAFSRNTGPSGYAAVFDHNPHLWTIQIEYIGSLIVYMSLLAMSRLSAMSKIFRQIFLIVYFLYIVDCWYGAMFVAGMLTCNIHLLTSADVEKTELQGTHGLMVRSGHWATVLIGLYLGGVPHVPSTRLLARNPGWTLLSNLKPEIMVGPKWIYLFVSATLIVWVVPYLPMLKKTLSSRPCQELGRLSYGLYLIHGPVMWTFGSSLYSFTGCCGAGNHLEASNHSILGLELEFILPHAILLPVSLELARFVADYVDGPSVRLGKWLYGRTLREDTDNNF